MYKICSYGFFCWVFFWGGGVYAAESISPTTLIKSTDSPTAVARDPTQPASYAMEDAQDKETEAGRNFILRAIVSAGDQRFAIINNKRVKVGDKVGHGTVKAIATYTVTLISDEGEIVLHVFGPPIKDIPKGKP